MLLSWNIWWTYSMCISFWHATIGFKVKWEFILPLWVCIHVRPPGRSRVTLCDRGYGFISSSSLYLKMLIPTKELLFCWITQDYIFKLVWTQTCSLIYLLSYTAHHARSLMLLQICVPLHNTTHFDYSMAHSMGMFISLVVTQQFQRTAMRKSFHNNEWHRARWVWFAPESALMACCFSRRSVSGPLESNSSPK